MKLKLMSAGIIAGAALTAIILLLSSFSKQDSPVKYLTVRTVEFTAMYDSKIIIVNENGQVEEIMLEKLKPSNYAANTQKITETFNALSKKGYRLVSATGDSVFGNYIFERP